MPRKRGRREGFWSDDYETHLTYYICAAGSEAIMSLRLATPDEISIWNKWLWRSHGLRELPNAAVYRCDIDFPMLLTPWKQFDDFALRMERDANQPIMTFRLEGAIRTIAGFWVDPGFHRNSRISRMRLKSLERDMLAATAKGLVWWGIEYPPESVQTTSFIRWFPSDSDFSTEAKKALKPDPPQAPPLETPLDLI
jgi:hypothetical protein